MKNSPVQIGTIGLQAFEIPTSVCFGGRYRLAVHNLAGGRRVVERLGPDDDEIKFQGTFSGPNAESRSRAFDELRRSGQIVWLTWESFRRLVVVKSFTAEYHNRGWIPFRVSCVVVHQAGVSAARSLTLFGLITADLGSALSAVTGSTISLTSLQTALLGANVLTAGTSDQVQAVAAVGVAMNAINSQIDLQSALVTAPLPAGPSAAIFGQKLSATVIAAGSLAAAVNARSYVGRVGTNLISGGN